MKHAKPGRKAISIYALIALSILVEAIPTHFEALPVQNAHVQHTIAKSSESIIHDELDDLPLDSPLRDSRFWNPPKEENSVRKIAGRFFGQRVLRSANAEAQTSMTYSALAQHADDVVLRFTIKTPEERKKLMEASTEMFLDVWSVTKEHVDVRVARASLEYLLDLLPSSLKNAHVALIADLQKTMLSTYPQYYPSPPTNTVFPPNHSGGSYESENYFFSDYQPLTVITRYMKLLQSLHPAISETVTIGRTYEGRRILALKVGSKENARAASGRHPRKIVIINGGSHAREWISTSTVLYLAHMFMTGYSKDRQLKELVDEFDWLFIPSLNTDGYVYTWEVDRLWRKNRMGTGIGYCWGVDLDRSWGVEWGGGGNACADNYQGEAPFSAPETRALADYTLKLHRSGRGKVIGFLDFHSYSQQVLYPYSHTCKKSPPNKENLQELAYDLAKRIKYASAETYTVSSACEGSGFPSDQVSDTGLSGSALDWFHAKANVPYSYQIKLRDTGSYGFLLPREMIVPTGREMMELMREFGAWILEKEEGGGWRDELRRKDLK